MQINEGTADRVIRVIVALVAGFFALSASGVAATILWIVTAILLVTGVVGFCPLYRLFGISTAKR